MFSSAKTGTYAFFPPKAVTVCLAAACAAIVLTATPSAAAPIGAVVAACDRTPGCNYTTSNDGSLDGCSPATCFTCSPRTRQCVATGSGPGQTRTAGKPLKGSRLISSLLGNAPATGSAKPAGSARSKPGTPTTVGNASAGDKPGSTKPLANTAPPKAQGFPIQRDTNAAGASKPESNRKNR